MNQSEKFPDIRVGQGIDVHPWEEGKKLFLGGVEIEHTHGLKGHSDGDALLHAITDAICGATGRGDIGSYFPDTDPKWKDADSKVLLSTIVEEVSKDGWAISNVDSTVMTELPKLNVHREAIKESIAKILNVSVERVGVKATTCEKLGFLGRGEGLMAMANVLLMRP